MVNYLLQANADANIPGSAHSGRTALQAAAGGGYGSVVTALLRASAKINAPAAEYGDVTAIQAAEEAGHITLVARLKSELTIAGI
jgi:ankyrin repeat protein